MRAVGYRARKSSKNSKVRYAVVGLGWIAQESVLPGFRNATKNSELVALVTDDPEKARKLSKEYDVAETVSYDGYNELLHSGSVDAVYIALPNNLHADFTIRAALAGVHVLCEKPMAASVEECESMTDACEEHRVKLMIAYGLHFEPGNLKAIEIIKSGQVGEPRFFSSVFGQQVPEGNIRLEKPLDGGPMVTTTDGNSSIQSTARSEMRLSSAVTSSAPTSCISHSAFLTTRRPSREVRKAPRIFA